jgi:hypothetical protein
VSELASEKLNKQSRINVSIKEMHNGVSDGLLSLAQSERRFDRR